jgi:choline-glycine betaine transporter
MLYFSKYSNLKLGKDNESPEYNGVSWFMMLFACGIGVGLFFYGVAEPIFHYTGTDFMKLYFWPKTETADKCVSGANPMYDFRIYNYIQR